MRCDWISSHAPRLNTMTPKIAYEITDDVAPLPDVETTGVKANVGLAGGKVGSKVGRLVAEGKLVGEAAGTVACAISVGVAGCGVTVCAEVGEGTIVALGRAVGATVTGVGALALVAQI